MFAKIIAITFTLLAAKAAAEPIAKPTQAAQVENYKPPFMNFTAITTEVPALMLTAATATATVTHVTNGAAEAVNGYGGGYGGGYGCGCGCGGGSCGCGSTVPTSSCVSVCPTNAASAMIPGSFLAVVAAGAVAAAL